MQHAAKTAAIQQKRGFTSIVWTIQVEMNIFTFHWLLQVSNQQLVGGQEPFSSQYFLLSKKIDSCRRGWKNRLPPKWASGQNVRWRLLEEEHLFTEYLSFFKFQTEMTKLKKNWKLFTKKHKKAIARQKCHFFLFWEKFIIGKVKMMNAS